MWILFQIKKFLIWNCLQKRVSISWFLSGGYDLSDMLLNVKKYKPYYSPSINNACCFSLHISFYNHRSFNTYRITAVLKNETDIITNIASSPIEWAAILVIMYVDSFKTNVIKLIDNIIMCWTYHRSKMFSIRGSSVILTISRCEIRVSMTTLPINGYVI